MSIFSSYKKIFLLGFIIVILIAIPFSVYIAQQRQRTTAKADTSTTLSFEPASPTIEVGKILTLDIVLDPKTGITGSRPNQVSFVKLSISFDPSKFTAENLNPSTDPKNTLIFVLEEASLTSGRASISLSIGADPTKVVTTKTKIAILQLKALSVTDANNPKTSVVFDPSPNTQVLSIASSDQTSENVLSTAIPVEVAIAQASTSTAPTPVPFGGSASAPTPTPISFGFSQSSQGISQGETGLGTGSAVFNPVFEIEPTPTPIVIIAQEPLPPTGPRENILGIGMLGIIFTIIGGALFLLL